MTVDLTWPTVLPKPLRAGYKIQPKPNVLRSDMEQGAARQRRRSTATMTDLPAGFVLDQWQLMIFEGWLEHRHQHGVVWFSIDLVGGMGTQSHEARFKGDVEIAALGGGIWSVTGTLEIRQRPILSDDDLTLFETEDLDALTASLAAFHVLVETQLWA